MIQTRLSQHTHTCRIRVTNQPHVQFDSGDSSPSSSGRGTCSWPLRMQSLTVRACYSVVAGQQPSLPFNVQQIQALSRSAIPSHNCPPASSILVTSVCRPIQYTAHWYLFTNQQPRQSFKSITKLEIVAQHDFSMATWYINSYQSVTQDSI